MEFVSSMESKLVRFKNLIYTYFQNKKKKKIITQICLPVESKQPCSFQPALPRMHPN